MSASVVALHEVETGDVGGSDDAGDAGDVDCAGDADADYADYADYAGCAGEVVGAVFLSLSKTYFQPKKQNQL